MQISTKKPKSSISDDCLSETVSDCSADLLEVTDNYKNTEPSNPGTPTNTTYSYKAGDTVSTSSRRRQRRRMFGKLHQNRATNSNSRRLLWEQVDWDALQFDNSSNTTSNSTDIFDSEGLEYELLSFPAQWYYSPMIVADTGIADLYGKDYSYSYFGVGISSFEDEELIGYCSIRIEAQDYSGSVLFLNNDTNYTTVKKDSSSFILAPGEYEECLFDLSYDEYLDWITDDLDVSSKAYAFDFEFSLSLFKNGSNFSDIYDAIIEKRKITVCTPLYRLRDRIICENGLRWFEPDYNLTYNCDSSDSEIDESSLADGFCDATNNVDGCFDAGDCCESSCMPGDLYDCDYFDCIDSRTIGFSYYYCSNVTYVFVLFCFGLFLIVFDCELSWM